MIITHYRILLVECSLKFLNEITDAFTALQLQFGTTKPATHSTLHNISLFMILSRYRTFNVITTDDYTTNDSRHQTNRRQLTQIDVFPISCFPRIWLCVGFSNM